MNCSCNNPILFSIKREGVTKPLYEIPNYSGYIPNRHDWITFPDSMLGRCCLQIFSRDAEFVEGKLKSVTVWVR